MALKVLKSGPAKPRVEEGKLLVIVTGENHNELLSPEAKKVAWNYRFDTKCPSGFGQAGIEAQSGVQEFDLDKDGKKKALGRAFVLTAGL